MTEIYKEKLSKKDIGGVIFMRVRQESLAVLAGESPD